MLTSKHILEEDWVDKLEIEPSPRLPRQREGKKTCCIVCSTIQASWCINRDNVGIALNRHTINCTRTTDTKVISHSTMWYRSHLQLCYLTRGRWRREEYPLLCWNTGAIGQDDMDLVRAHVETLPRRKRYEASPRVIRPDNTVNRGKAGVLRLSHTSATTYQSWEGTHYKFHNCKQYKFHRPPWIFSTLVLIVNSREANIDGIGDVSINMWS